MMPILFNTGCTLHEIKNKILNYEVDFVFLSVHIRIEPLILWGCRKPQKFSHITVFHTWLRMINSPSFLSYGSRLNRTV